MRSVDKVAKLLLLLLVLSLAGCSASKKVERAVALEKATATVVAGLPSVARNVDCLSGGVRMKVTVNGETATTRGRVRIKQGEGVQISATAMGLMEAACFEFLRENVRFIYKLDKIYADSPYSGVPFLAQTETGYTILEAILLNRIFSPNATPFPEALASMQPADEGAFVTLTTPANAPVVYKFYIDKANGALVKSEGSCANGGKIVCEYSNFEMFDGALFPTEVTLSFNGSDTQASIAFTFSALSSREFKFSPRRISTGYRRVSLEGVLDSIGEETN